MKGIYFACLLIVGMLLQAQNIAEESSYVCPPCGSTCDEVRYDKPGVCGHCNMVLVKESQVKTIAFYLQDRVEVLDFAGPLEVFAYSGYEVFTVSKTTDPIKSQGILSVIPDYSIENAPSADILAFFGGNSGAASQDPQVINWIKKQEGIQHYFSVCTGAFVLAEAGILDGKTATTFHSALDNLEQSYPEIDVRRNARFVDNGRVITTAGVSAGIDGALHLVAKLQGVNAARRTAYYMEYENWQPRNGLILTENPYDRIVGKSILETYTGTYEHKSGNSVSLSINREQTGLMVQIMKDSHPLYFEERDFFTDERNEPVFFVRDDSQQVIGYSLTREGPVYKKLD